MLRRRRPDAWSRRHRSAACTTATTASPHSRPIAIRSPTSLRHWVHVGVVALDGSSSASRHSAGQRWWRVRDGLRRVEACGPARISPDRLFGSYTRSVSNFESLVRYGFLRGASARDGRFLGTVRPNRKHATSADRVSLSVAPYQTRWVVKAILSACGNVWPLTTRSEFFRRPPDGWSSSV